MFLLSVLADAASMQGIGIGMGGALIGAGLGTGSIFLAAGLASLPASAAILAMRRFSYTVSAMNSRIIA
jgi:hypothetical protein